MDDSQRKAILIGVGIGAVGYLLGRLSSFDDVYEARLSGIKAGWTLRKILMETIENVRTESKSSSSHTASATGTDSHAGLTPCTDALPGDECNLECSAGPSNTDDSKEIENEVDCFGDAGNGTLNLPLQEGFEVT